MNRLARRLALAATALALAYSAGWYVVASRLETIVLAWIDDRRAQGWTATYDSMRLEGFPFAWRARLEKPVLASDRTSSPFRWSGPVITLGWKPWRPERVGYVATGEHRIAATGPRPGRKLSLTSKRAEGDILFGGPHGLKRLIARIDGALLESERDRKIRIDRIAADIDTAPLPRGENTADKMASLRLVGSASGITLPENGAMPLGRTVGNVELDATVLGRVSAGSTRQVLAAWRNDGGIVEIDRFGLGWSRLTVEASGSLALDSDLQPVVGASGTIQGHQETLTALTAAGTLKPGEALMARMALTFLERQGSENARAEIRVSLAIQDGWLHVGPVRLFRMPLVRWDG